MISDAIAFAESIGYENAAWRPGLPGTRARALLAHALEGVPEDLDDPHYVRALASLGISALLVGAAGWAAIELGRYPINDTLNNTTGGIRGIADVMVGEAGASLRQWLNLTLATGAGLVIVGVFVAMTGSVVSGKQGS